MLRKLVISEDLRNKSAAWMICRSCAMVAYEDRSCSFWQTLQLALRTYICRRQQRNPARTPFAGRSHGVEFSECLSNTKADHYILDSSKMRQGAAARRPSQEPGMEIWITPDSRRSGGNLKTCRTVSVVSFLCSTVTKADRPAASAQGMCLTILSQHWTATATSRKFPISNFLAQQSCKAARILNRPSAFSANLHLCVLLYSSFCCSAETGCALQEWSVDAGAICHASERQQSSASAAF